MSARCGFGDRFFDALTSHSVTLIRTRLLTVLVRDGFMYYTVMLGESFRIRQTDCSNAHLAHVLALGILNLVFLAALPANRAALAPMLTPVLRASFSIIGSRLMLNLRGVLMTGDESVNLGGTSALRTSRFRPADVAA